MRITVFILISQCLLSGLAYSSERYREVQIVDPFIELRTGAGRGYPVFLVVERGATITLLKRKTDWFKVRTNNDLEGWVDINQLEQTLAPSGEKTHFPELAISDFAGYRWLMGVTGGDYGGAQAISLFGGYRLAEHLSTELTLSQALGNYSSSVSAKASLLAHPFTEWRVSPFFTLGTGAIRTMPRATLVQTPDRTDQFANVGIGVQSYLSRRFVIRAEYNDYVVFSATNDHDANEEIHEWKAGFAIFF
jgi:hypothetical protein